MTNSSYNYCEQYYEVDRQMSETYDDLWSAQTTSPSFVAKQAAEGAAIYMEVWEMGRKVLEQMNRAISQGAVTAADMDEAIYKVSQCMRYAEKSAGSYRFLSDSAAQRR